MAANYALSAPIRLHASDQISGRSARRPPLPSSASWSRSTHRSPLVSRMRISQET